MRESAIEQKTRRLGKALGLRMIKFKNPAQRGAPDRLVLGPGRKVAFIEFKAPGEVPTPLQQIVHEDLRSMGFAVYVVDNAAEGARVVLEIANG